MIQALLPIILVILVLAIISYAVFNGISSEHVQGEELGATIVRYRGSRPWLPLVYLLFILVCIIASAIGAD